MARDKLKNSEPAEPNLALATDEQLRNELAERELTKHRKKIEQLKFNCAWVQQNERELLALAPEHTRRDCNDNNLANSHTLDSEGYYVCSRCRLLSGHVYCSWLAIDFCLQNCDALVEPDKVDARVTVEVFPVYP